MIKSLYSKLAIALLGLFCLLGVSIVILTQVASDMYQQEVVQKLNRELAGQIVAQKNLMQDHQINQKGLTEIFNMLMVVNPSIEVYLLNPGGDILAYSAPPGKVKQDRVDLRPIKRWFLLLERGVWVVLLQFLEDIATRRVQQYGEIPVRCLYNGHIVGCFKKPVVLRLRRQELYGRVLIVIGDDIGLYVFT